MKPIESRNIYWHGMWLTKSQAIAEEFKLQAEIEATRKDMEFYCSSENQLRLIKEQRRSEILAHINSFNHPLARECMRLIYMDRTQGFFGNIY